MEFYKLPNGEVAGFDDPSTAPAGSIQITAEQFATASTTRVLTLLQLQTEQTATLTACCQMAIESGFTSSALGSACTYPSDQTTQLNQNMAANSPSGGGLWCSASTTTLTAHTQAQAQQVCADFVKWLNACQTQLASLLAQVNAPSATIASVSAVSWTNPA